jgi:alkylation response protein AidB-like acyl-CoA dehydrogenase
VCRQRKQFLALRGDDPAWAQEIGRYATESLAVEALRMRRA